MSKGVTIILRSGSTENDDALFCVNLAEAILARGAAVHIFLYGNGCNLGSKPVPREGRSPISDALRAHMDASVLSDRIEALAAKGARIATCHTTEYSRGIEGLAYLEGVEGGDVGDTFNRYLMGSDTLISIGR